MVDGLPRASSFFKISKNPTIRLAEDCSSCVDHFEARGKPSTVFPRAGPVETERSSIMLKIQQQDHYTINNSSANYFVNAPPDRHIPTANRQTAYSAWIACQTKIFCLHILQRQCWNLSLKRNHRSTSSSIGPAHSLKQLEHQQPMNLKNKWKRNGTKFQR